MLQKHNQAISARLESFNDGILDSLNKTNNHFWDATLKIEATTMQLWKALQISPLYCPKPSSKLASTQADVSPE